MAARKLAGIVLLFLVTSRATCFPATAAADTPPIYWSQWGGFSTPGRLAADASGNVYVADTFNNRILRFSFDGSPLPWDGSAVLLSGPRGIAAGPDGAIYVSDTGNNRIIVFNGAGGYLRAWGAPGAALGQFNTPLGITVDIDNFVYVADAGNHRVQKFFSDGTSAGFWGAFGTGDGQFNQPQGITSQSFGPTRWIYVTDYDNHRVQKFTGGGAYLGQWGSNGSGNGQFVLPQDVTFGDDGFVYVSDTGNHRIQKFNTDGVYVGQWGAFGAGNGQLDLPLGIGVVLRNVFVVDSGNNRIQRFIYPLSINASAGTGGSISPSGTTAVIRGGSQSYLITPSACYHVADVAVDGVSQGAIPSYTFSDVIGDHTISATFAVDTYTITASPGANGSINPTGAVAVNCGASQSFTITPSVGHHVSDVIVDGAPVGPVSSYAFNNVQANHTINALFAPILFEDINAGLPGVYLSAGAWGDYDNDGDLDIVVTGYPGLVSRIYRNTSGSFADIGPVLPLVFEGSAAWGDFDSDGDLDLALTGLNGGFQATTRILRNTGGTFVDIGAGLPGVFDSSVAWGDYDNDGDLDLALTGRNDAGTPLARIYRNTAGTFVDIGAGLPAVFMGSVAWGDYDNDGDLDLLLAGDVANGGDLITRLYANNGGNFVDIEAGLPGLHLGTVAWGDYDNDGDLDLALTGDASPPTARVYRNSSGAFADIDAGLPGRIQSCLAWGDYDNDGDLDLAFIGGGAAQVYRNTGGAFVDMGAGLAGVTDGSIAWGDYDNDGDLDLLLTGDTGSGYISRIYRNNSPTANSPPAAPTGLVVTWGATKATFHWSAASDAQTPSSGLSYNLRIGTTPGGGEILSPMAAGGTGYRRVAQLGNANQNLQWSVPLASLPPAWNLYWGVQAVDQTFAGSPFAGAGPSVGVAGPPPPSAFAMRPNEPNPFRSMTRIGFDLPVAAHVELRVFDAEGRLVRKLVEGEVPAGTHEARWSGDDATGRRVRAGVYFYRLRAGTYVSNRRMLLIE
jgi:sugar lactone lactonase YvrE